ncbi:MAG: tRNA-Thr(GGU) m(6)t(6)A37 methyltransferase TsaA [Psychromonas sp.]|jgi:tRNA-Thr(GGU) m(6)t(6)A37 methyltransferase TsaA
MGNSLVFDSIATIHSPYKEKFAVPRQPGLVPSAKAELEILPPYDDINAFLGLQEFSHLWLVFIFHKNRNQEKWSPTVRPPRLGGNKRLGVFATRSPCRPNPVGLSLVEFHGIKQVNGKIFLMLSNIDLVEGTPIIDIKPYIPYADSKPKAVAGFAQQQPESLMQVEFSTQAQKAINLFKDDYPEMQQLIIEVLQQDPRPAYKKKKEDLKIYAVHLLDFNISWMNAGSITTVVDVEPLV